MRSAAAVRSSASSFPERTARSSERSIAALARSTRSGSNSTSVTSTPQRAQTSAIPLPIKPPPTTPTRMARDASASRTATARGETSRPCAAARRSGGGREVVDGDDANAVRQLHRARQDHPPGAPLAGGAAGQLGGPGGVPPPRGPPVLPPP